MGGRHAAIERHNHEDIDACQQCLDNGKPRYRRFVEHRCSTRPCHTGRRTRHCSVHHLGHPVTRSFPLRMRHPQRQPHRRPIPQFSGRFFHTLMYEIISITSSGAFPRVDRWVAPPQSATLTAPIKVSCKKPLLEERCLKGEWCRCQSVRSKGTSRASSCMKSERLYKKEGDQ